MKPQAKALAQFRKQLQETIPIRVIPVDGFAFVAAGGDVVTAAGPLEAVRVP